MSSIVKLRACIESMQVDTKPKVTHDAAVVQRLYKRASDLQTEIQDCIFDASQRRVGEVNSNKLSHHFGGFKDQLLKLREEYDSLSAPALSDRSALRTQQASSHSTRDEA